MTDTTEPPRAAEILATARPGDMVVVAILSPDRGAAIHTVLPQPLPLVNLATSLLDQAKDMLHDEDAEESELCLQVEDALALLPDRFDAPGDGSGDGDEG